ncbi:clock controlled protein (Ccg-8), putative [Talaromyces stipitatus ATCC 10500]|uniref:Clock controlled protein (Ccg-8), putative n=1 Tax=Talaromyces stipitatus (strain ATCC 10500 / CBS 375.48 / QM 6759 / NRRL 1006) TaxID=441959 RepID=B8MD59_TALSN|nr:clock controlled protein (Ccg-8), putative [Talaromyces stipitatus ATCC 10500]EED17584.1 clock controlled protein (Ccg-8), putative [Talaromyces stipitatus ATCC 10500]
MNSPNTIMDVDSNSVDDRARRATSVLSMDDIEAAQALEGLRSDFAYTPPSHPPALSQSHPQQITSPASQSDQSQAEPLISLLTSTHPLISSAINSSMSAYTSSKSYSSRFKYGAEFLERNIGSPVANTVGTVSRKTGVEGGLRWALQRRDTNESTDRNKRRKTNPTSGEVDENTDLEKALPPMSEMNRNRSISETSYSETLPPYDDQKSPNYEEIQQHDQPSNNNAEQNKTWQSRLMISTSGLGVAMSEESLRRLTYCLKWLKWANGRLNSAVLALKSMLEKWEEEKQKNLTDENSSQNRALLLQHMQAVKEDVLRTLKQVVNIVSKYTGGALPENAGTLVRSHLISLPQRFKIASTSTTPSDSTTSSSEEASSAHRVLVLAQEGLEMMSQVHRVVDETLVSAQTWCERLGRKLPDLKNDESHGNPPETAPKSSPQYTQHGQTAVFSDVKQPIVDTSNVDVEMTGTDAV